MIPGAILRSGTVHFEISVSRELFVGLVALLVLFNTYMISMRLRLRRSRREVISTAIQSELLRLQSFSDPLTDQQVIFVSNVLDDILVHFIAGYRQRSRSNYTAHGHNRYFSGSTPDIDNHRTAYVSYW